jgi:hypothetical protein
MTVSFYNRTDWDWLSLESPDISVASTSTANTENIAATIDVPNDVNIGSYEGAVRFTYDDMDSINEPVLNDASEGTIAIQLAHQDITGISDIRINSVSQLASTYTLDAQSGTIIFNAPLSSGDIITADYSYSASSIIIPVLVNIEPSTPRCTFGGPTIINVADEVVTDVVTYSETDEWLFEVEKQNCDETISVPTYDITNELLANNANVSVTGEQLSVYWDSMEVAYVAAFDFGGDTGEHSIVPGSVKIYNGTTLLGPGNYTIYEGTVTSAAGPVLFSYTIDPADTFIAEYAYYRCNWDEVLLERENIDEYINVSTIKLFWADGTEITSGWGWMGSTFTVTINFTQPIPAGEMITVDYTYYQRIQFYTLKFDTAINENTTYIQASVVLDKNGVQMIKDLEYKILEDGRIKFIGSAILKQGDIVVANYDYYALYRNWTLNRGNEFHETIVNGSFIIYNNSLTYHAYKYTIDCKNGNLTFDELPLPGDNLTINYRYYNTSQYTLIDSNIEDSPYGFNYGLLNHNNIIEDSQIVYKKEGVTWNPLIEGVDYEMDLINGSIIFKAPISPTDEIKASYAYSDTSTLLFNPNGILGGNDRRFYYIYVPDQGLNQNPDALLKLSIDVKWGHKPSDVDIAIWGEATRRPIIPGTDKNFPASRYGEITIEELGSSAFSPTFLTATNESNELLSTTLQSGLNVIELETVAMNGTQPFETIEADVGTLFVSEETLIVYTQNLSGKAPISVISNLDWPGANVSALGPAVGKMYINEEVYANDPAWGNYKSFQEQLATGQLADEPLYTMAVEVRNAATFEVHIWGYDDCPDLDLGVFLDENEDGKTQTEEFVDYGADWDADEEVLIVNPEDGTYLIRVFGFALSASPGHFDMKVSMILSGVEGYGVEGRGEDIDPLVGVFNVNTSIPAFTLQTYNLTWNFPGDTSDDEFGGVIYIGPSNAPEVLSIVAKIVVDRKPPIIKENTRPLNGAVTNDNRPLISAGIEDLVREEIDGDSVKLFVDDTDVTSLAKVSVELVADSAGSGYPQGQVIYTPNVPLSEGGHIVELRVSDWAGNEVIKKWSFTVDTIKPVLTLTSISDVSYTNQPDTVLQGWSEADADISVILGARSVEVKRDAGGGFTADIILEEGDNRILVIATDIAGNEEKKLLSFMLDTEEPRFERIVCVGGTLTNEANTLLTGSISEQGTMSINGEPTSVNSDGTFNKYVELSEGENTFAFEFTDMAGNIANTWLNVTLDTQAPDILLGTIDSTVTVDSINITGSTEAGANIKINGKLVQVEETRQQTGTFNRLVRLSPGQNIMVIESRDAAGNVEELYLTVTYDDSDTGTNYGAIGLMVLLLIIGLLLGIFIFMFILGERPPKEEEPEEEPEVDEDIEPIPDEEAMPEELPEDDETEIDGIEPISDDTDIAEGEPEEELPEDLPEEDFEPEPLEDTDAEPEIPVEDEPEILSEESDKESIEDSLVEEDERVVKLRQAYEDGKISKELFERNLAKFQE